MVKTSTLLEITIPLLMLAAISTASLLLVRTVEIDASILHLYNDKQDAPISQRPLVFLLPAGTPFSDNTLQQNRELHNTLTDSALFSEIFNLFTVKDFVNRNGTLRRSPVADPQNLDPYSIARRLQRSPTLSLLLLSENSTSWLHYATPVADINDGELLQAISALRHKFPRLAVGGEPYWEAESSRAISSSLTVFIILGLLFLAGGFFLLLRSIRQALVLWFSALIAMLGTGGIIGLLQQSLSLFLLPVPILILGLATSYTLHIRAGLLGHTWTDSWRTHGKIVLFTALTTIAGLSGMLFSATRQLQIIGAVAILGVILAAAIAFIVSPLLYHITRNRTRFALVESVHRQPFSPRLRTALMVMFGVFLLGGWLQVQQGSNWAEIFWSGSSIGQETELLSQEAPGQQEIEVILQHPTEYYWVDYEHFRRLYTWSDQLVKRYPNSHVYGVHNIVAEIIARWEDSPQPIEPVSTADVGEALELTRGESLFALDLIDTQYQTITLRVQLPEGSRSYRDINQFMEWAQQYWAGGRIQIDFSGRVIDRARSHARFLPDQMKSLLLFLLAIIIIHSLSHSSPRKLVWILLPPAIGIGTVLAVYGWLGWNLFIFEAIIFAVVAGVGVDDAIIISFLHKHDASRKTIIATTVILCITFSAMLFTSFFVIFRIGLMTMLGLSISTVTVLALSRSRSEAE